MKVKSEREVAQSCLTLRDPMDCSRPGSSVHGIFQARVLEWGTIAFSSLLSRIYQRTALIIYDLITLKYNWYKESRENAWSFYQVLEKWVSVQSFEGKWYTHIYIYIWIYVIYISLWTHGVESLWYIRIPYSHSFLMLNLLHFFSFFCPTFQGGLVPF